MSHPSVSVGEKKTVMSVTVPATKFLFCYCPENWITILITLLAGLTIQSIFLLTEGINIIFQINKDLHRKLRGVCPLLCFLLVSGVFWF